MNFFSLIFRIFILFLSLNNIKSKTKEKTCGKIIEISNNYILKEEELKTNEEESNTYIIKTNKTLSEMESLLTEDNFKYLKDKKAEKARKKAIKKAAKKRAKELKKRQSKILIADSNNESEVQQIYNIDILNETYLNNLIYIGTNDKSSNFSKKKFKEEDSLSYAYSIITFLIVVCLVLLGIYFKFRIEKSSSDYFTMDNEPNMNEFIIKSF